jgi:hypothetical protein
MGWDEARILEIESNSRYRKYKESTHMVCLTNPISQPNLDISPIWIPLIYNDVSNSQRWSTWRSPTSPEDENRSSVWNVVLSSF